MGGGGAEEEVRTKVMMTRVYVKASAEDKMERVFSWIPRELHSQPPSGKKKAIYSAKTILISPPTHL